MAAPSRIDDAAPRGYRVLFELGRGGMGAAFLASAEGAGGFERLVVIKRIRPERFDPRSVERFLREAKVAAAIHHAHVVSAQSVGEDAEGPFIVLDYVDGASLEELLDRSLLKQQAMPVPIMLRVALDTLAGLEAVHGARDAQGTPLNVLHRDVSLQNTLVGRDGVARLLDFGIARSDLGGATTDQRYLVGKLPYLPPEYLRREPLTPSADVYGLGVTLWLTLTGQELWPGASEAQVLHHILNDGVPRLSDSLHVAPDIVELVARATAPERAERFVSAREMAAFIEGLDRQRGWLATHHEVAEWLERLAGVDLARRRERIAAEIGTGSRKALRVPLPSPALATMEQSLPKAARVSGRALPLLVALALTCVALVLWAASERDVSSAGSQRAVPSDPNPSAITSTIAGPSVHAAPSSESAEPSPLASTAATPSAETEKRSPGGDKRAVPKASTAATATPPPPEVHPPDHISKRNPYRD
jgi:serine/threonine protein kinase